MKSDKKANRFVSLAHFAVVASYCSYEVIASQRRLIGFGDSSRLIVVFAGVLLVAAVLTYIINHAIPAFRESFKRGVPWTLFYAGVLYLAFYFIWWPN